VVVVDLPFTNRSGNVGVVVTSVMLTVVCCKVICFMQASKTFVAWMQMRSIPLPSKLFVGIDYLLYLSIYLMTTMQK
jgi:hypothetical protein